MKLGATLEREATTMVWTEELDAAAQEMLGGYPGHTVRIARDEDLADADVEDALRSTLEGDLGLPGSAVRAEVAHGWVTIRGHLDSWADWQTVESAALALRGVRGVDDRVTVDVEELVPEP